MLSVLIPANNEAECIEECLKALLASDIDVPAEVIVIANACTDNTVEIVNGCAAEARAQGWKLVVLDLEQGGKLNALNRGEVAAQGDILVYLDADVVVSPQLMTQLVGVLSRIQPAYASGSLVVAQARSWISRAYRRIYTQVPFITHGVPGCGLFAVNASGRARWGEFPDIISDDTFVRLQFTPHERHKVPAPYVWPIVEGFRNLVKVRRRQDHGVAEIARDYPELLANDDKPPFGKDLALKLAIRHPVGFAVYCAVALAVRLPGGNTGWSRGR